MASRQFVVYEQTSKGARARVYEGRVHIGMATGPMQFVEEAVGLFRCEVVERARRILTGIVGEGAANGNANRGGR
jgi:hypothetical protein